MIGFALILCKNVALSLSKPSYETKPYRRYMGTLIILRNLEQVCNVEVFHGSLTAI